MCIGALKKNCGQDLPDSGFLLPWFWQDHITVSISKIRSTAPAHTSIMPKQNEKEFL